MYTYTSQTMRRAQGAGRLPSGTTPCRRTCPSLRRRRRPTSTAIDRLVLLVGLIVSSSSTTLSYSLRCVYLYSHMPRLHVRSSCTYGRRCCIWTALTQLRTVQSWSHTGVAELIVPSKETLHVKFNYYTRYTQTALTYLHNSIEYIVSGH